MYNINRVIKKLTPHRSAAELFKYFSDEKDCVFLDSSLVNGLGRYSIIGMRPYLKLVKDDHGFFINEQKVSELSFEEYLKKYLSEHESDIIIHKAAKKAFDELGLKKLPSVSSLQKEYAALLSEKKEKYADYYRLEKEKRDLLVYKANTERLLQLDAEEPQKSKERQQKEK